MPTSVILLKKLLSRFFLFFLVGSSSASLVANSKRSLTPSKVRAEHSMYLTAPMLRATDSAFASVENVINELVTSVLLSGIEYGIPVQL
jgi:hypothetical protein